MTTPRTLDRILKELGERIEDAEDDYRRSFKEDPNCYGTGYDSGFLSALREIYASITGDEYTASKSP